jgi:hypothetical protein
MPRRLRFVSDAAPAVPPPDGTELASALSVEIFVSGGAREGVDVAIIAQKQ